MTDSQWRRPAACSTADGCVEVRETPGFVYVRNGERPSAPSLAFTRDEFRAFIEAAKSGEYDDLIG